MRRFSSRENLGARDVRQLRERLVEILVALRCDLTLCAADVTSEIAPKTTRTHLIRSLAVAHVETVDDIHAMHNRRKRSESHRIQASIVAEIDEELRRARVWSARRKRYRAAHVLCLGSKTKKIVFSFLKKNEARGTRYIAQRRNAHQNWIVFECDLPALRRRRLGGQAELGHEAGHVAKELDAREEIRLDEFEEASGADWRQLFVDLDDDRACHRARESKQICNNNNTDQQQPTTANATIFITRATVIQAHDVEPNVCRCARKRCQTRENKHFFLKKKIF